MHILLANDDGYDAPGLAVLTEALVAQHHKVTVVAPRENKSGCGMGLSLRRDISVVQHAERRFIVDGTPADCVYIGLNNLVDETVDLVMSGINNGSNLADDILYSGTFAAAMEARRLPVPAIAMSITQRDVRHYDTAARLAVDLSNSISRLAFKSLISVLNVNLPDVPMMDLRGYKATLMGARQAPLPPTMESGDITNGLYRLGPAGDFVRRKRNKMQDFEAVEQGYASITPLSVRFEDSAYVDDVQQWLDTL